MGKWLKKRMDEIAEFNPRESIKKWMKAKKERDCQKIGGMI